MRFICGFVGIRMERPRYALQNIFNIHIVRKQKNNFSKVLYDGTYSYWIRKSYT